MTNLVASPFMGDGRLTAVGASPDAIIVIQNFLRVKTRSMKFRVLRHQLRVEARSMIWINLHLLWENPRLPVSWRQQSIGFAVAHDLTLCIVPNNLPPDFKSDVA